MKADKLILMHTYSIRGKVDEKRFSWFAHLKKRDYEPDPVPPHIKYHYALPIPTHSMHCLFSNSLHAIMFLIITKCKM